MDGTPGAGSGGGSSWETPGGPGDAFAPPTQQSPYTPPLQQQPAGPWGDPRAWNAPYNAPTSPPMLPRSMNLAVSLMYAGAALLVLGTIVFFATTDQLADAIAEANPELSQFAIDDEVDQQKGQEIFRLVLGVSLWIWMAVKNGQGRKWARVVGTIFGVISLLGTVLGGLIVGAGGYADDIPAILIIGVVSAINALTIMVLFFRPDASAFYNDSERWKASRVLRGY